MKEFTILNSASTSILSDEVATFLNNGWELHGYVFNDENTGFRTQFHQALTKETPNPTRCCSHASCYNVAEIASKYCKDHTAF